MELKLTLTEILKKHYPDMAAYVELKDNWGKDNTVLKAEEILISLRNY